MTKIHLSKDEWWPVPDIDRGEGPYGREPNIDLPEDIVAAYEAATGAFMEAAHNLAAAAYAAGDDYWKDQW